VSVAIYVWSRWAEEEANGKKFMDVIKKLEKVQMKEGIIKESLSVFFNGVLNYTEEMGCIEEIEEEGKAAPITEEMQL
jgi:heterodisulfide reductase subunit C